MASQAHLPASAHTSALKSLLDRAIPYEKVGAFIPYDLMQFGLFGTTIVIVGGLFALMLPSAAAIRHSDLYILLGGLAASLESLMAPVAVPALIGGGTLLVLDAGLMHVRTSARWRYLVVAQAVVGGVAGAICALFLAVVLLNFAIWIAICALVLVVVGVLLAAMAGGG